MFRILRLAVVVIIAVLATDFFFRSSILQLVHPVILEPADGATVAPPVSMRWDGPQQMRVTLRYAGRDEWPLGIHESPFELPTEHLHERGLYSVEIRALTFGDWINASRSFANEGEATPTPSPAHEDLSDKLAALEDSLQDMRDAQEDTHDENTNLYEENATIREENAILTEELQQTAESEQRAAGQLAALQQEFARLSDENRGLLDELIQLRSRLSAVVPCTVWGYNAFPRMFPGVRRAVIVSDPAGEIFRAQSACEMVRRADEESTSVCFCVGSSFGD